MIDLYLNHPIGFVAGSLCSKDLSVSEPSGKADYAISVHWPEIFAAKTMAAYKKMYNIHPGFLPYGRGRHPVFWALWNREPLGATLHEITEKLDAGPIIAQKQVYVDRVHITGYEAWMAVMQKELDLFRFIVRCIRAGQFPSAHEQQSSIGSYHEEKEIHEMKKETFWRGLSVSEQKRLYQYLIFPGYTNLEGYNAQLSLC